MNRTPTENEIIEEYLKRQATRSRVSNNLTRLRDPNFPKQNEVLEARQHRFKAVNCTRRSGKSFAEAIDHFEICEEFPGSRTVYMGLTLDSVSEIIWDVFKELDRIGQCGCKFNETKKIVTFPNKSRIRLFGLDSSAREIKKVLGQKLRKVSIDEAGSFTQDMVKICYQMIRPALIDLAPNSWLTLLGTCENIPNTFFEKVTKGLETGADWKVYKWTAYDNPHMKEQWGREINDILKSNPLAAHASWFRTHYLNEWCSDDELLIIKIQEDRNYFDELDKKHEWLYVLGVDLGYNDASSFSVVAYSRTTPVCHCVFAIKETELDFTGVANQIRQLQRSFDIGKIIVDGANKQGVEEIKNRHQIPLEAAEKSDKATYLHLLRDDLIQGAFKLKRTACGELVTEWGSLQWKDEDKQNEDPRCQNHLSDATLYAWRYCKHYTYTPAPKPKDKHSTEYMEEIEAREAEKLRRQVEQDDFTGDEWLEKMAA